MPQLIPGARGGATPRASAGRAATSDTLRRDVWAGEERRGQDRTEAGPERVWKERTPPGRCGSRSRLRAASCQPRRRARHVPYAVQYSTARRGGRAKRETGAGLTSGNARRPGLCGNRGRSCGCACTGDTVSRTVIPGTIGQEFGNLYAVCPVVWREGARVAFH